MLAAHRCVPKNPGDEFRFGQLKQLAVAVAMIDVLQAHVVRVGIEGVPGAECPTFDIASQVQGHTTPVLIRLSELNVPVFAVLGLDGREPVLRVLLWRQPQGLVHQGLLEVMQHLAAEQAGDHLDGQQVPVTAGAPLALGINATAGDQAMHMRVLAKRAAPRVQRHDDARGGTKESLISAQLQQALAGAVEQQFAQCGAVVGPQWDELVRQGEDRVIVLARQQPLQLLFNPLLAWLLATSRAAAMAARVVLNKAVPIARAAQNVTTHGWRSAVHDGPCSASLTRVQRPLLLVLAELTAEDLLQ